MKKALHLFSLLSLAILEANAAPPAFYTNQTDFFNALAGRATFTETFGAPLPGGGTRLNTNNLVFSNGSFSFTANIPGVAPATSFWSDTFGSTNALSTGDPVLDVFVFTNISPNTAAFGGYFFPTYAGVESGGNVTLTLLLADSSLVGVTNASRNSANINDWFFGWVTEEPGTAIQSVTYTAGIDYASASNVTLAVPEPSTYALLGLAAAGLAGYVIRRRRS